MKTLEMNNTIVNEVVEMNNDTVVKVVNGGFEMRDLRNVKNAAKVIAEKSTVVLEKKKGKMLGLQIRSLKDGKVGVNSLILSAPENKFTRELEGKKVTVQVGNTVHKFDKEDRFLDEYMAVSLDAKCSQMLSGKPIYVDLARGVIAISVIKNGEERFENILTNRALSINTLSKMNKYKLMTATAAGLRAKKNLFNAIFVKLEADETVSKVLNKNSYNIIKYANKSMNRGQATKFFTRPALSWTENKVLGKIKASAQLDGVFDFVVKRNTFDGFALMPDTAIARIFKVDIKEARKLSLQARPGGAIKVQIKVVPKSLFDIMIDMYKEQGRLTFHGKGYPELLFDDNAIKAKVDLDNLELSVLALGKTTKLGTSKAIIEKFFLEAARMDFAKEGEDNLKNAVEFIENLGKQELVKLAKNFIEEGNDLTSNGANHIYDIINKGGLRTIPAAKHKSFKNLVKEMAKMIDKLSFKDGNMYYSVISTDMGQIFGYELIKKGEIFFPLKNREVKKGLGIKYPTMGAKEYYSFETVTLDTIFKRIDATDASDKLKDALKKEYKGMSKALVILPASREVFDSCAGLDIDMDPMAIVFTEEIVNILHGKEQLVTLITEAKTEKSEVQKDAEYMLKNALQLSAKRGSETASRALSDSVYDPSKDSFHAKMFEYATTTDAKSIGAISNENCTIISAVTEFYKGNKNPLIRLIEESTGRLDGKRTHKNKKYKGLPINPDTGAKILSVENISKMLNEILTVELNDTNLELIANDLSACPRLYQETSIDAAKTGITVETAVTCFTIKTKSLMAIDVKEGKGERNRTTYKLERNIPEFTDVTLTVDGLNKTVETIVIEDDMSIVQDRLIEFASSLIDTEIAKYGTFAFKGLATDKTIATDEHDFDMTGTIAGVLNHFSTKLPAQFNSSLEILNVYGALASEYGMTMEMLSNEDASEDQIEMLRNQFDAKLSGLSNTLEYLLKNVKGRDEQATLNTKGSIMIGLGALTKGGKISSTKANQFALNVAPHYALAYAFAGNTYTINHEVLHCDDSVETGKVEVFKGFSDDNTLIVKDNFKDREDNRAILDVERLEDGTVKVTETKAIEVPEYDENKATIILDAEIVQVLGADSKPVYDAAGIAKTEVVCNSGKVLKAISYELRAKKIDDSIEFSFDLNGETRRLVIPADKVSMAEGVRANTTYNVTFGYAIGEGKNGRVVLDLAR